ncbi:MAG: hypothetical protein LBS74_10065 [Oscillospiraceae bacterium]|nr:hypothetical protein [Oscillospiraceae bacterium]
MVCEAIQWSKTRCSTSAQGLSPLDCFALITGVVSSRSAVLAMTHVSGVITA